MPQADAAPAPIQAPAGTRIARPAAHTQSGAPAPAQTRFTGQRPLPGGSAKPNTRVKKLAMVGGIVVVLGVGGYFGVPYVLDLQDKANAKRREAAKKSDGGEMGHIANLYNVLDATEPGGRGLGNLNSSHASGPRQRPGAPGEIRVSSDGGDASSAAATASAPDLPVIHPVWTLDPRPSSIPEGRANGVLSGTNFLVEIARVDPVGTAQVLRLMQGPAASPDREILIYLHPKAGETLAGHSWTVTKDMFGSAVPQVKKHWKSDPKYAPILKTFAGGYALKLEFGQLTNNALPGKIFVALPDPEQSVVAGLFNASLTAPSPVAAVAPAVPMAPARTPQSDAFQKRYGKSP